MIHDRSEYETEQLERIEPERQMPREKVDTPEMKAKIAKARERAAKGGSGPGSTADDLITLARELRRVDSGP